MKWLYPRQGATYARNCGFSQDFVYFLVNACFPLISQRSKCGPCVTPVTISPDQMGGLPCIRGLRIPVATIVAMVADGMTETEILDTYPDL